MIKRRPTAERIPFTNEELERLSVSELVRLKLTEEERSRLRELNLARQQKRAEFVARLRVEEEPILQDLRVAGQDVTSVWDLVNTSDTYTDALPVLLKHLQLPYHDEIRGGLARALAVREAAFAWPVLMDEYRKAPEGGGLGAKEGLAVALSATVTNETLGELIAIAKNPAHGPSRLALLLGLRRSRNPLAKQAIADLADDPVFRKEIASWRKSKRRTDREAHSADLSSRKRCVTLH